MSQSELPTGVDTSTESNSKTVYVVTVRWDGSPHPDVLGVYENESDADTLMRKCRNWPREWEGLGPVAWEKKERTVQSIFDPERVE